MRLHLYLHLPILQSLPHERGLLHPRPKGRKALRSELVTKYIALNELGVQSVGVSNVGHGGTPVVEGTNSRVENFAGYVKRQQSKISPDPREGSMTTEQWLKKNGFEELPNLVIRLI